ncbi:MAG: hypothetical protein HON09_05750 [Flavobacteriaceae bacterium]|jgi:hypothetical protein|nr:hypothetical protein [Flavobacteriaceae bacterium]
MDKLDKLKENWQSKEHELPKVSFDRIYKMLLKKSSSIVKWIFVISIVELLFWISLYFILPEDNINMMKELGLERVMFYCEIFHFFIFGIFIILFYKNYKSIQVTDSTNVLMQNILNTRKTVRYFVYYNVGMAIAFSIAIDTYLYNNSEKLYEVMDFAKQGIPKEGFANIFIISQIIVGLIIIALLILFYWFVYGILLKKLKGNYKELKKINS